MIGGQDLHLHLKVYWSCTSIERVRFALSLEQASELKSRLEPSAPLPLGYRPTWPTRTCIC